MGVSHDWYCLVVAEDDEADVVDVDVTDAVEEGGGATP